MRSVLIPLMYVTAFIAGKHTMFSKGKVELCLSMKSIWPEHTKVGLHVFYIEMQINSFTPLHYSWRKTLLPMELAVEWVPEPVWGFWQGGNPCCATNLTWSSSLHKTTSVTNVNAGGTMYWPVHLKTWRLSSDKGSVLSQRQSSMSIHHKILKKTTYNHFNVNDT